MNQQRVMKEVTQQEVIKMVGILPTGIDYDKFKGFVVYNSTNRDMGIVVNSDYAFPKEFLLRPRETFYARVGDLVSILSLEDCRKLYITKHLEDIEK